MSQILSDDMPMADRQAVLQQQQQQQLGLRRSWNASPTPGPLRRGTPDKLSAWREGVRADIGAGAGQADQRWAEMKDERERAAAAERVKATHGYRGGYVEERMRQKDMIELHQEALRKMQAGANWNSGK